MHVVPRQVVHRVAVSIGVAILAGLVSSLPRTGAAQSNPARGWLGIAMANETTGVRIEHVIRGSPADRAGLHSDDRIKQVDGVAVTVPRDVIRAVASHAAGDTVAITATRDGKTQQVRVLLADFPSNDEMLRMDHVGSPAPAWDGLTPTSGFPSSLASLRGHVVIVDFWATWCGPCRGLAPVLSGWQARYGAQGLSVVGITTDSVDQATVFRERLDLRYPMASDSRAATSLAYGVFALPTMFIVDKRGIVREVAVGTDPEQEARMEALINGLLSEPAATP